MIGEHVRRLTGVEWAQWGGADQKKQRLLECSDRPCKSATVALRKSILEHRDAEVRLRPVVRFRGRPTLDAIDPFVLASNWHPL